MLLVFIVSVSILIVYFFILVSVALLAQNLLFHCVS